MVICSQALPLLYVFALRYDWPEKFMLLCLIQLIVSVPLYPSKLFLLKVRESTISDLPS